MAEEKKDGIDELDEEINLDEVPAEGEEEEDREVPAEDLDVLKSQIEKLQEEKDGMYHDMIGERRTRQELSAQIENINKVVGELRDKNKTESPAKGKIKLKFDGDEAYLDPADLEEFIAPVKDAIDSVSGTAIVQSVENENARAINNILQSDPSFPGGYKAVQDAWKFLNGKFESFVVKNNIDPNTLTLDKAVDLMEEGPIKEEFTALYPGIDLDLIVEANSLSPDGKINSRKLRKAIKLISSQEETGEMDKLKFIATKPGNLAGQTNRRGGGGRTLNDIADINVNDFMNLSDSDIARLEQALGRSET